jgi:hypothetical protein
MSQDKRRNTHQSDSINDHQEKLEELSKRVHGAMVDLGLSDPDEPSPGCHWEFVIGPNGVERKLVC